MRQETFTLSQKELQRVSVISACIKGDMACARAAGLLGLSMRQIKRLKKRMREDGEAALAHANRGRPSHRRLPKDVATRIVQLARGTYAGFNDHHLCEKLVEREGFPLVAKRCVACYARTVSARHANAVLPLIASAACVPHGSANWCNSMAARTTGSKAAASASPLSACRTMPPERSWPRSSFPPKPPSAISACCDRCCSATGSRSPFTGITVASSSATTTAGPSTNNSLE